MHNARLYRKAYIENTLHLESNITKDLKNNIEKIKPLIDPLRFTSNPIPVTKLESKTETEESQIRELQKV